jgi:hypothetical protein
VAIRLDITITISIISAITTRIIAEYDDVLGNIPDVQDIKAIKIPIDISSSKQGIWRNQISGYRS